MSVEIVSPIQDLSEIDNKVRMAILQIRGPKSYEKGGVDLHFERFFKGVLLVMPVIQNNKSFIHLQVVDNKKLVFNVVRYDEETQSLVIDEVDEGSDLSSLIIDIFAVGW